MSGAEKVSIETTLTPKQTKMFATWEAHTRSEFDAKSSESSKKILDQKLKGSDSRSLS